MSVHLRKILLLVQDLLVYPPLKTIDLDTIYNLLLFQLLNKNIYFIYLNIDEFGPKCENIKFLPGTADMKYKRMFINTVDAMLYARNGGETFGLACGEFSICDKPIIAGEIQQPYPTSHMDILGDAIIKCSNYENVYEIITNWNKYNKDVRNNGYHKYTPDYVMQNFKVYLDYLMQL